MELKYNKITDEINLENSLGPPTILKRQTDGKDIVGKWSYKNDKMLYELNITKKDDWTIMMSKICKKDKSCKGQRLLRNYI